MIRKVEWIYCAECTDMHSDSMWASPECFHCATYECDLIEIEKKDGSEVFWLCKQCIEEANKEINK